ncbi:response regulator transcription factor [Roseateles sp.]|uniref:response regulator transcription factor n=1 Tax=Roseateles sp. TaxID=1971397 RepID=UPI003D0C40F8
MTYDPRPSPHSLRSAPSRLKMSKTEVLIVDDDAELAGMLVQLLQAEGWAVKSVLSAEQAERSLAAELPQLVLLDVMLPDASGMDLCRRWRSAHPALGILMLTARGDPFDRVLGLELGADDYLPKPFEKRELVARVRALLRRQQPAPAPAPAQTELQFGSLSVNLVSRELRVNGLEVPLTGIEFKLLLVLARTPGQAVSRQQLSDAVQASAYRPQDRTVDVQVGRLRRRLAQALPGRDWIETVRGEGYAFVPREAAEGDAPADDSKTL